VVQDPALLLCDLLVEFLVDGDERFALHLVVEVAQVGCPVGVTDDALQPDLGGVSDPEPAAQQDQGEQPPRLVFDGAQDSYGGVGLAAPGMPMRV
jgi:hypothetical protein